MTPTDHVEIEAKYDASESFELPLLIGVHGITVVEEPVEQYLEATYYDTDGLALARAGVTLRRRTGGGDEGWHLKLPRALDERLELRRPLGKSEHVPQSLAELVAVRSKRAGLCPVAIVRTRRTVHRLFGTDGGPVAEVADDHVEGEAPGTAPSIWREIEVESTGGNPSLLASIGKLLEDAGAKPSDAPSKLARVLAHRLAGSADDDIPAAAAEDLTAGELVRRHLADQMATFKALDPLVRRDFPDAVHKMRVTVRRLRSAMATYRRLLDKSVTEPLREELKWLGDVLGEARDAEVIHARLRAMIDEQRPSLVVGPVRRRLDRTIGGEHRQAHRRCVTAMRSDRYFSLLDSLDHTAAGLALTGKRIDKPADSGVPKEIRRSLKRLRRHVKVADALDAAGGDEKLDDVLHEVRKAAKRVRYGAESAEPVSGAEAETTVEAMKQLQEVLGDHQDTVVTRAVLRRLAADAHAAGEHTFTWGRLHALEEARGDRSGEQFHSIVDDIAAVPSWLK
ncbi:MAG: CYTH and CHAD domain-containing protein [Actinomycetota bacterium]|nr:CYTH and CHAD domain-containing protein [Actinomycetota bacterium]